MSFLQCFALKNVRKGVEDLKKNEEEKPILKR